MKKFLSKEKKKPTCPFRPTPSNANNFNNSHPIAPQPTFITKQIIEKKNINEFFFLLP
jgi:hypothetical protein